jgi:hypothetical protein
MTAHLQTLRNRVHRALAVLENDGPRPTQQHVADFRLAWNALVAGAGGLNPYARNTVH